MTKKHDNHYEFYMGNRHPHLQICVIASCKTPIAITFIASQYAMITTLLYTRFFSFSSLLNFLLWSKLCNFYTALQRRPCVTLASRRDSDVVEGITFSNRTIQVLTFKRVYTNSFLPRRKPAFFFNKVFLTKSLLKILREITCENRDFFFKKVPIATMSDPHHHKSLIYPWFLEIGNWLLACVHWEYYSW